MLEWVWGMGVCVAVCILAKQALVLTIDKYSCL